ncbi:MAG TPA: dolichol kinase [Prolixibacteraceae bacterium]|nr:dolichol kinase [Prolixibacteraceae bacterium]
MNTNRLSMTLAAALNEQMTKEAHASQIYLSYASWADLQGFEGIANFLFRHAEEERNHMMKILKYILDRGAEVKVTAIPAPHPNPLSINNCFEKIFEHEVENTKAVYSLVKMSFEEDDWSTWNFMQWFVKEQIEEEALAMSLLDKIKIAGGEKVSNEALYTLDRDLKDAPDSVESPQEATAEKP